MKVKISICGVEIKGTSEVTIDMTEKELNELRNKLTEGMSPEQMPVPIN